MYIKVKELPDCLIRALQSVEFGGNDISVSTEEKVSLFDPGEAGRRGFFILVDLSTGERKTFEGSWGGSNMFNPGNQVDLNQEEYSLPENGAVVRGSTGYPRTFVPQKEAKDNYVHHLYNGLIPKGTDMNTGTRVVFNFGLCSPTIPYSAIPLILRGIIIAKDSSSDRVLVEWDDGTCNHVAVQDLIIVP